MSIRLKVVSVFLACWPLAAHAAFDNLAIGPRSSALAGSDVAHADDLSGMFLNPAALVGVNRWEAFANYDKAYMGLSDGSSIGRQVVAFGAPFRWGTVAVGYDQFSAASLYTETAKSLMVASPIQEKLWLGAGLRMLSVGYAQDAYTAQNPVFQNGTSKSAVGINLGMMYFGSLFNWGVSINDANQPNLGLKYANTVDRKINLGLNKRVADLIDFNAALTSVGSDKQVNLGAEMSRARSAFVLRGGVSVGSRDYRTLAAGIGYKAKIFQIDYAMNLPLSGIDSSLITHQVGCTVRWGFIRRRVTHKDIVEAEEEEEYNSDKKLPLVKAKPAGTTEDEREKARQALEDARKDILGGRFRDGLEKIKDSNLGYVSAAEIDEIKTMTAKAEAVTGIYTSVNVTDAKSRLVAQAISAYMQSDGKRAVNAAAYAYQLYPQDAKVGRLRAVIVKAFPLDAFELKLLPGIKLTDQKLHESLELIYEGKYIAAIAACKEVLDLDPRNVLALIRMGSSYWAMGMEDNARNIWLEAQKLDPDNEILRRFLDREPGVVNARPAKVVSPNVEQEFRSKMAYYERLKRSGADNATLATILQKILEQYEGVGVDLTEAYKDYEAIKK